MAYQKKKKKKTKVKIRAIRRALIQSTQLDILLIKMR
jgi:hypothetical protein